MLLGRKNNILRNTTCCKLNFLLGGLFPPLAKVQGKVAVFHGFSGLNGPPFSDASPKCSLLEFESQLKFRADFDLDSMDVSHLFIHFLALQKIKIFNEFHEGLLDFWISPDNLSYLVFVNLHIILICGKNCKGIRTKTV